MVMDWRMENIIKLFDESNHIGKSIIAKDLINLYYETQHNTLDKGSCEDCVKFLLNMWNDFCLEVIYTEWCDPYNIR